MTTTSPAFHTSLRPAARSVERSAELAVPAVIPPTEPHDPTRLKQVRRRHLAVASVSLLMVAGLVAGLASLSRSSAPVDHALVCCTVQLRDLPITVTERGTTESQQNVQVICEVDDIQGDGINGTTILWIVENGSLVEKGDLVVELDSASHRERIEEHNLKTIYARGQFTARTLDYQNRLTHNKTVKANAELAVQTTRLRLRQFEDEQGGTFQIALHEIELGIQQQEARQQIDDRNLVGTEHLHELGYKSKGDLAQAHLQALRAKSALHREAARRRELVDYSYVRSKLQLEGALQSAERALTQVGLDNKAALAQNRAWLKMAEMGKTWHETRLARYHEQLGKCKIYAPQSGMVAYHVESNGWGQSSTVATGVAVRNRQSIMSIPDLSRVKVMTSVHETVVDRVKAGMRATVRLDAFPNRHYDAVVDSVDVLPDPGGWLSSGTQVYQTVVTIDQEVERIKPGMTAVVEIQIADLHNVLCVPIQAIVQRGEETWCFVAENGQVVQCPIETGNTTDKFVEICSGLSAGDRVVLNPNAILADRADQEREIAPDKENSDCFSLD